MRMRGIEDGFKEIKANDPNTALTKTALRRLITTGVVPHVKIGTKYLVDMDVLERYLCNDSPMIKDHTVSPATGIVRRVEV